ncbi:MAG: DUF2752 domain-containing protein [Clostridiales bacterium]|nr:DUF2752 domain-containing protein [Clostridiales bacterium]
MKLIPKNTSDKSRIKWIIPPLYAVGFIISNKTGVGCIWKALTGVPCPGCGFSRAVASAFHGDFARAFHFHPLFWTLPLIVILFITDARLFKNEKANEVLLISGAALFGLVWVYRLITGFPF